VFLFNIRVILGVFIARGRFIFSLCWRFIFLRILTKWMFVTMNSMRLYKVGCLWCFHKLLISKNYSPKPILLKELVHKTGNGHRPNCGNDFLFQSVLHVTIKREINFYKTTYIHLYFYFSSHSTWRTRANLISKK
jgi:hypothetical protein